MMLGMHGCFVCANGIPSCCALAPVGSVRLWTLPFLLSAGVFRAGRAYGRAVVDEPRQGVSCLVEIFRALLELVPHAFEYLEPGAGMFDRYPGPAYPLGILPPRPCEVRAHRFLGRRAGDRAGMRPLQALEPPVPYS